MAADARRGGTTVAVVGADQGLRGLLDGVLSNVGSVVVALPCLPAAVSLVAAARAVRAVTVTAH